MNKGTQILRLLCFSLWGGEFFYFPKNYQHILNSFHLMHLKGFTLFGIMMSMHESVSAPIYECACTRASMSAFVLRN